MIEYYELYQQIENWEEDLLQQENENKPHPTDKIIKNILSYSRAQSVYSKTLNENIKIWLN